MRILFHIVVLLLAAGSHVLYMPPQRPRRAHARSALLAILVLAIGFLNVYPWPAGRPGPMIFGILPASLGAWILWTLLFMALIAYIAFWKDPYGWVNKRRQQLRRENPRT